MKQKQEIQIDSEVVLMDLRCDSDAMQNSGTNESMQEPSSNSTVSENTTSETSVPPAGYPIDLDDLQNLDDHGRLIDFSHPSIVQGINWFKLAYKYMDASSIEIGKQLGNGHFGQVFVGRWNRATSEEDQTVAVKKMISGKCCLMTFK